jgi:hypothetical protein
LKSWRYISQLCATFHDSVAMGSCNAISTLT